VRRVRIEDTQTSQECDDSDRLRDDDEVVLDADAYETAQRERLIQEQHEAERHHAAFERREHDAEIAAAGGLPRERDLVPVEADPAKIRLQAARRMRERLPTEEHARKQARKVVFPADALAHTETGQRPPKSPYVDIDEGTIVELWHGEDAEHEGEALSLRGGDRHFKEDRETQAELQPAREWLGANDPHLTSAGVTAEIEGAFRSCGLSLKDARAAFPNGRPNAAARGLRTKVRAALLPIYEADRKRVLMSDILGCSRTALHTLMSAKTKP
jgi:hypothetical protein